jgi:hypothetical protein
MTRYILLAIIALLFIPRLHAQQGMALGVNVGANATFLVDNKRYGDVVYKPQATIQPAFGIAVTNLFNDNWGLAAEYNFAWLGQDYEMQDSTMANRNGSLSLRYHQIPVMVAFSGGDYRSRFLAMFGPQFSYLQSASQHTESNNVTTDVTPGFRRWDVGLLAVAGGNVTVVDNFYISAALRFYYGLKTVNTNRSLIIENAPNEDDFLENGYAGLSVGLHYLFRKEKPVRE